jgi:hypothetical protein
VSDGRGRINWRLVDHVDLFFEKHELSAYLRIRNSRIDMKVAEIQKAPRYPMRGLTPRQTKGLKAEIGILRVLPNAIKGRCNSKNRKSRR